MGEKNNIKSPSRRRFLQCSVTLIPLAVTGSNLLSNRASAESEINHGITADYVPSFFNKDEWRFILAAVDRLIPADHLGPGGVSEGVPEFIDKQMELPYGYGHLWYMQPPFVPGAPEMGYQSSLVPRETYRRGIQAINHHCRNVFLRPFDALSHNQQESVLRRLEKGALQLEGVPATIFFSQLQENTHEGYLADPLHGGNQTLASWKMIGFPGARADFPQVMDNPDKPYLTGPVSISGRRSS